MKTDGFFKKALIAIALMFTFSISANAQFDKIIKKAKNTVTGTVETMANKAVDKGKEKARKKMYETVKKKVLGGKHMPEQPWPMSEQAVKDNIFPPSDKNPYSVTYYVYNLCNEDPANIRKLKEQLDARYQANRKILMARETGLFSQLGGYSDALLSEIEKEQDHWATFYSELRHYVHMRFNNYKKKDVNGQGAWEITWSPGDIMCPVDKTTYWIYNGKNGKIQFFSIDGRGAYASPMDVALAKEEVVRMNGVAALTEGLVSEGSEFYGIEENEMALIHALAVTWSNCVNQALANNTPDNLEKAPMPKAGSLNKSLKAKALAIAKESDPSIVDVVITSNTWDIKREGGVIKNRVVYGYVIRNTEMGKHASKRSWCQDYQGGGKYGGLRSFGVGTESFYVK